jgi:hypothetical protein
MERQNQRAQRTLRKNRRDGLTTSSYTRLLQELESIADGFREVYTALAESTELATKARLNEAVLWAESFNLERSIYLAGVAKEHNIKEPYRTQFKNLPAHACVTRYRQSYQVAEWIKNNIEAMPHGVVAHILESWQSSFLSQFNYFATDAYLSNPKHNQTIYHRMLGSLLTHRALTEANRKDAAGYYGDYAYDFLQQFIEPHDGMHYMQANYLRRASKEFATFIRLSTAHPQITDRLADLAAKTLDVELHKPAEFFSITPYLVTGTRAASVAAAICGGAAAFGFDLATIQDAISSLWSSVSSHVLHAANVSVPDTLRTIDTGGMSRAMLAFDTGGMSRSLLADTGGMARLQSIDLTSLMA